MSRLQLLILWALAIAAGLYYFKSKDVPDSISSKTKLEIGSDLVSGKTIDTIDSFKINAGKDSVTLKKKEGEWVVAELADFPANLTKVSQVLEALRNTKVSQGVVAADEYYDRFNLSPSSEDEEKQPDSITLMSGDTESALVYLGKTRAATGGSSGTAGRFVSLSDDDSGVYIVQETFGFLGADSDTWINKILTPLEEGVITMEIAAPNDPTFKPWTVSRKTVLDDLIIQGLSEKEETKTNDTALLKNAFAATVFIEMINEEDYKARSNEKGTRTVQATDSGGSTFLITLTPEKKKIEAAPTDPSAPVAAPNYFVTIEVLAGPTKPAPLAADAGVQEKAVYQQRVENLAELAASVNRMSRTYEGRYFVITSSAVSTLTKNRGEIIKPKVEKKKPVSVATPPVAVPTPGGARPPTPRLPNTGRPPAGIARPKEDPKKKTKIEAVTPPIQVPPTPGAKPAEE